MLPSIHRPTRNPLCPLSSLLLLGQWSEHVVRGHVSPERPVIAAVVVGRERAGRVVERVEEAPGADGPVPRVGHPYARSPVAGAAVHPGRVVLGVSQGLGVCVGEVEYTTI